MAGCRGPDSKLGKEPQDLGAPPGGGTMLWPRPSLPRPLAPAFTVSSSQPHHSGDLHGFNIPEAAAARADLLPWAGQLIYAGVHPPSWFCSGYKVT